MERIPATPTTKATADWFTGDVYYDVIVRGDEPSRIRVEEHRTAFLGSAHAVRSATESQQPGPVDTGHAHPLLLHRRRQEEFRELRNRCSCLDRSRSQPLPEQRERAQRAGGRFQEAVSGAEGSVRANSPSV